MEAKFNAKAPLDARVEGSSIRANPLCVDPMQRHEEKNGALIFRRVVASFEPHHIIPKAEGGSDSWDNLMAFRADCHKVLEGRGRRRQ
jgi:hypothetical protein